MHLSFGTPCGTVSGSEGLIFPIPVNGGEEAVSNLGTLRWRT